MSPSALARLARPAGSPLIGPRIQAALGAVATLATIGLSQGSAQAYVVSVGGVQYDVTAFTGSYDDNTSKFQTAANGGMMPWWGNQAAAMEFASAVGTQVGTQWEWGAGAFFGYSRDSDSFDYYGIEYTANYVNFAFFDTYFGITSYSDWSTDSSNILWAKATLASSPAAPAPGPLPILGAAAAFGASRKLRRRMKAIKVVASTATVV